MMTPMTMAQFLLMMGGQPKRVPTPQGPNTSVVRKTGGGVRTFAQDPRMFQPTSTPVPTNPGNPFQTTVNYAEAQPFDFAGAIRRGFGAVA